MKYFFQLNSHDLQITEQRHCLIFPRRLRPDSSFASSTSSRSREVSRNVSRELSRDVSREATPPPTSSSPASRGNVVPNVVPAADPLDYLETLSIGESTRLDFRGILCYQPLEDLLTVIIAEVLSELEI